jgi:hypothetical protein
VSYGSWCIQRRFGREELSGDRYRESWALRRQQLSVGSSTPSFGCGNSLATWPRQVFPTALNQIIF